MFERRFGAPGASGTLIFLHATGLNASAYAPLLRTLDFDGEILALSLRGHGETRLPADPSALTSWQGFADDVAETLRGRRLREPLAYAGHSAGAVTALLLSRRLPPRRLLMIEPVVLSEVQVWLARSPLKPLTVGRIGIARKAAARRDVFPSKEAALRSYQQKPFFAGWRGDALEGYVEEGFEPCEKGVRLRCRPAFEAACFTAQAHGFWPHLRALRKTETETTILAAKGRTTFPQRGRSRAQELGARVTALSGGHMLPVENTEAVAAWMSQELE